MGQQQLLLIVLGVIIVGVAVVAGISMFNANAEESAKDELISQCLSIGANAQQMYMKPVAMGGLGSNYTGEDGKASYSIPASMSSTTNGNYTATAKNDSTLSVSGKPRTDLGYKWTVVATVTPTNVTTEVVTAATGNGTN